MLVVCFVVKNISRDSSSAWKFFLVILDVVPVLFFAPDFSLLSCMC